MYDHALKVLMELAGRNRYSIGIFQRFLDLHSGLFKLQVEKFVSGLLCHYFTIVLSKAILYLEIVSQGST